MRRPINLSVPLIVACSALLLCIGVIAGLTAALLIRTSDGDRSGAPNLAAVSTVDGSGRAMAISAEQAQRLLGNAAPPLAPGSADSATAPVPELSQENATSQPAVTSAVSAVPATVPVLPSVPTAVAAVPEAAANPTAVTPVPAAVIQPPLIPQSETPATVLAPVPVSIQGPTVQSDGAMDPGDYQADPAVFAEDLRPMGQWVATPEYGACWTPAGVPAGWQPYTAGEWAYTQYGWTWMSDEPWGHITYHYGSWVDYPRYGWIWVPGRTWAPAWVAWRYGNGYVGWAPLPPAACRADVPVAEVVVMRIPPSHYCFVEQRWMMEHHVGRHMAPPRQNVVIINYTQNITKIDVHNRRVTNRSLLPEQVQHMTGRRPPDVHMTRAENNRDAQDRQKRGEPVAYRPQPQRNNPPAAAHPTPPSANQGSRPQSPVVDNHPESVRPPTPPRAGANPWTAPTVNIGPRPPSDAKPAPARNGIAVPAPAKTPGPAQPKPPAQPDKKPAKPQPGPAPVPPKASGIVQPTPPTPGSPQAPKRAEGPEPAPGPAPAPRQKPSETAPKAPAANNPPARVAEGKPAAKPSPEPSKPAAQPAPRPERHPEPAKKPEQPATPAPRAGPWPSAPQPAPAKEPQDERSKAAPQPAPSSEQRPERSKPQQPAPRQDRQPTPDHKERPANNKADEPAAATPPRSRQPDAAPSAPPRARQANPSQDAQAGDQPSRTPGPARGRGRSN